MSRGDIEAFLIWMKVQGLQVSTRVKYLNILEAYLTSWGNNIIRELKADKTLHLPITPSGGEIRALTLGELQHLLDCTYKMPSDRGQIMRAVIALGFGTGCRPKEILGAEVRDVDVKRSRFC
ncbi:hypothetical protein AUQ37_03985 [Candidatus Methanomethylophilus sp. 1R26]|uniref:hypothetical protein n=1 Tax=Candidatus Methanomethylophilus sp. 1R26 TaxID=1769296 RepID=UPI000736FA66|nr:hypothetical protein [Candidatus Methanomethylophilus sp. 1R26]KUE73030.1 hypothetical protein AUQ37_03985 [Candidatus Methanomethylophilus sp. 1R26]